MIYDIIDSPLWIEYVFFSAYNNIDFSYDKRKAFTTYSNAITFSNDTVSSEFFLISVRQNYATHSVFPLQKENFD